MRGDGFWRRGRVLDMQRIIDSYYRSILNAIPLAVFVVDDDVGIHSFNTAAADMFGLTEASIAGKRGGDVLCCLHAAAMPEGCGHAAACLSCVIRNSVYDTFSTGAVVRKRMRVTVTRGEKPTELDMLITANPLPGDERLALLILEDVTELSVLRSIVPICANCKKVRNDNQYWQNVDSYFHLYMGIDFSHGICPECMKVLYPSMGGQERPKTDR